MTGFLNPAVCDCSAPGAGHDGRGSDPSGSQRAHVLLLQPSVLRGNDRVRQPGLLHRVVPLRVRRHRLRKPTQGDLVLQGLHHSAKGGPIALKFELPGEGPG
jgi:hypothetical protein